MHPNIMAIPFIRTLLVFTLCAASALADDNSLAIGHWRFDMPSGLSTGEFYFEKEGRFRWVMSRSIDPKPFADSGGTYKLADGALELRYDSRPEKPQKWRYTVDANNFTIGDMTDTEKMVYKRVIGKK